MRALIVTPHDLDAEQIQNALEAADLGFIAIERTHSYEEALQKIQVPVESDGQCDVVVCAAYINQVFADQFIDAVRGVPQGFAVPVLHFSHVDYSQNYMAFRGPLTQHLRVPAVPEMLGLQIVGMVNRSTLYALKLKEGKSPQPGCRNDFFLSLYDPGKG